MHLLFSALVCYNFKLFISFFQNIHIVSSKRKALAIGVSKSKRLYIYNA